ncbi:hypothetical protein BC567DRAFT_263432 [Phyllosticta citribraziliensis]
MKFGGFPNPNSLSGGGSFSNSRIFETAVDDYARNICDPKKDKELLAELETIKRQGPVSRQSFLALIENEEGKTSDKKSTKIILRFVKPVIEFLTGHYNVIDTICQADPTPSAIIWGCLKIVISSVDRAVKILETFREHFDRIKTHLDLIDKYEALFRDSNSFWAKTFLPSATRDFDEVVKKIDQHERSFTRLGGVKDMMNRRAREEERDKQKLYKSARKWLGDGTSEGLVERTESSHLDLNPVEASDWIDHTPEFQDWTANSTVHPIMWLTAKHGAGKSVLCSQLVRRMKQMSLPPAVAYFSYRFDETVTEVETLQNVALQLLRRLWKTKQDISPPIQNLLDTPKHEMNNIVKMICAIIETAGFSRTYIFIDGVDEDVPERRSIHGPDSALNRLISLASANPKGTVRVWVSSQDREGILTQAQRVSHVHLRLSDQNSMALQSFIERERSKFEKFELSQNDLDKLTQNLRDAARGNFLCARLMIDDQNPVDHGASTTATASIEEYHLAEVCVRYLSDPRFKEPLKLRDGEWKTADGESIESDGFLRYSAKYWKRHLDAVEQTPDLQSLASRFLDSTNYQTHLQYKFVASHFSELQVSEMPYNKLSLGKVNPQRFAPWNTEVQAHQIRQNYREFIHEWSYLYKWEIDRCLFNALGGDSFTSQLSSRYKSFVLGSNEPGSIQNTFQCYDGFADSGEFAYMLQFVSRTAESHLRFVCETWNLKDTDFPILQKRQFIDVDEKANWQFHLSVEDRDVRPRRTQEKPIAFEDGCRSLRIGSAIFVQDNLGAFIAQQPGISPKDRITINFEEFRTRPGILVVATRRKDSTKGSRSGLDGDPVRDVQDLFETRQQRPIDEGGSDSEENGHNDKTSSISSEDSWSSADESWSEASSEATDILPDENFLEHFKGHIDSSSSESSVEEQTDGTESEPGSGSDFGGNIFSRFRKGFHDDDSDGQEAYVALNDSESDDNETLPIGMIQAIRLQDLKKQTRTDLQASIQIFRTSESGLEHLFRLRQPLHLPLFDSPPAIHPRHPLVVWPVGPSTIIFLDYERKTYFIRKLRPSKSYTRQVSIKCHFSPCGKFLHIATVEAHRKPKQRNKTKNKPQSDIDIRSGFLLVSMFVATYRLDNKRPTRSVPVQIRREKILLGIVRKFPVRRLPLTLTWTPEYLYVTRSEKAVYVQRVGLFPEGFGKGKMTQHSATPSSAARKDPPRKDPTVAEPRDIVFLPSTSTVRSVRFFPETAAMPAKVLIGSEPLRHGKPLSYCEGCGPEGRNHDSEGHNLEVAQHEGMQEPEGRASLPIGVYLNEEEDLGGWTQSKSGMKIMENRGVGQLDFKAERFDIDDGSE